MPRIRGVAILNNPVLSTNVPTPAGWINQTISFTCTLSNSATTCTAIASVTPVQFGGGGAGKTGNITYGAAGIGAPITGAGIVNGTYVSAIVSATAITLSQNTTASAAGTLIPVTVWGYDPSQSFPSSTLGTGTWGGFALPPVSADTPAGNLLEVPWTVAASNLVINNSYVLPPGDLLVSVTSGSTGAQLLNYQGPTPSYVLVHTFTASTAQAVYVPSDGLNWCVYTPTTAATAITIYQFR
jgi:hypothetical protein